MGKKMTSAFANKLLKSLEEEKNYWLNMEASSSFYTAAMGEEPVIPEYDYETVAGKIAELDDKTMKIKHAINLNNIQAQLLVGETAMSIDMVLVRMAQLNRRKDVLDNMRKQLPKTRVENGPFSRGSNTPEYRYINYDMELVKAEYERISDEIMQMQIALDKHNQTVEFEVEGLA